MKYIIGILIGLIVGFGGYFAFTQINNAEPTTEESQENTESSSAAEENTSTETDINTPISEAAYLCKNARTVRAVYFQSKVIIELSDGRAAQLPQVESASGAKYANSDESLIFWRQGADAFVEETGQQTFTECNELDTDSVEVL